MHKHVALIGDSVFDNGAYTLGEPDVAAHLRTQRPGWEVTLLAVDGSTTEDFSPQLAGVGPGMTDLVVSLGGNDAILNSDLLDLPIHSTGGALDLFEERLGRFAESYRAAIGAVLALGKRTTLCTIYDGRFPGEQARRIRTALMMFNDVIQRTALGHGLAVIELRQVCNQESDFANPIEPSGLGGGKIAAAIAQAIDHAAGGHR